MEIFRLEVAEQLTLITDALDMESHLSVIIETIILDNLGMLPDTATYDEFQQYVDSIIENDGSKADDSIQCL